MKKYRYRIEVEVTELLSKSSIKESIGTVEVIG